MFTLRLQTKVRGGNQASEDVVSLLSTIYKLLI